MKKFEYKAWYKHETNGIGSWQNLGKDGWELVAVDSYDGGRAYFKREIIEEQ